MEVELLPGFETATGTDELLVEIVEDVNPLTNDYPGGEGSYESYGYYRYGFNGKENDNEVKGSGNQQDYGERNYDPRIGRLLSVDPLRKKFPFYTPYNFAANKPIWCIDYLGLQDLPATNPSNGNIMSKDKFAQAALSTLNYQEAIKRNENVVLRINYEVIPDGVSISDINSRERYSYTLNLNTAKGFNPPTTRSAPTTYIDMSGQYFADGRSATRENFTMRFGNEPAFRFGQTVTTSPVMTPQVSTTPIVAPFDRNNSTLPTASVNTVNNFISTIPETATNLNATVGIGFSQGQTGIAGPFPNATLLANARGLTIQGLFSNAGLALSLNPPAFNTRPQISVSYQTNNMVQTATSVTTQPIRQALNSNGASIGAIQSNGTSSTTTVPNGGTVPASGTTWNN